MISNAIHKNCDWQTFLPDVEQPTGNNLIQHDSFINSHRTEIRETSAYVLSCYFYNLTSPQNGAAIFFSAPNKYLMIECSTFFDCHKSNSGDAGAFYVNKGNIVMNKVRGFKCTSDNNCAFCCIIDDSERNMSHFFDCSLSNCISKNQHVLYIQHGTVELIRVNMSHNSCKEDFGFQGIPSKSFEYKGENIGLLLSFSSLAENNASSFFGMRLENSNFNKLLKNINFIKNEQKNTGYGMVYCVGKTHIQNSCIMLNTGSPIFQSIEGETSLINCSVDSLSTNGNALNTGSIGEASFINGIAFLNVKICTATFDTIEGVSMIIDPDSLARISPSKDLCPTLYCGDKHEFGDINIVRAFKYFWFLSFISTNPSDDFLYEIE